MILTDPHAIHATGSAAPAFDLEALRAEFPILQRKIRGRDLVYLDNAATSQKPRCVLDAIQSYYCQSNANVHRGVHRLSEEATDLYEGAREKVRAFINASSQAEIIFTRGTTEAINLVAQACAIPRLKPGDVVIVSNMEHHSNLVPWQMACAATGAQLRIVPIDDQGAMDLEAYRSLLDERVKFVALNQVSNALGTINPAREMVALAKQIGAITLLDGAQAVPHLAVDVQALDCDFYAFSGHKMYAPTGIGVLFGRRALLEQTQPWQGGGDMIRSVSLFSSDYNDLPYKFEAGTPHIEGAIALGAAIDFIQRVGIEAIAAHEHELLRYGTQLLLQKPGLRLIGTAPKKAAVLSFYLDYAHPHDAGTILNHQGIAVRTGHHCAQPVMERFGVPATIRASLALYNTREELDALAKGLDKIREVFG